MAKKIYKLFMFTAKEAWYQLSPDEQEKLMAKEREISEKAGAKTVVLAESSWSSEEWLYFGVDEFPDLEAVEAQGKALNKINWFRYLESKVILGSEFEGF